MRDDIKIILDFITKEQEQQLIAFIPKSPARKTRGRNRILRYGSDTAYANNIRNKEVPKIFDQFREQIKFDSVTINEYYKDQFITWHIDNKNSGDKIVILSLMSDAIIKFMKKDERLEFTLPARSLTIFEGEIRWDWMHYLQALDRRYSIVFRDTVH